MEQRIVMFLANLINVLLLIKVAAVIYIVKQNSDSAGETRFVLNTRCVQLPYHTVCLSKRTLAFLEFLY